MRKRKYNKNTTKLGIIFIIILFSLASLSASYSAWTDSLIIESTVNTLNDYNYLCLHGYWALDETTPSTIALDSSLYDNDGTLSGGPVWQDTFGINGCLEFDGIDDYVYCNNDGSFDITDEITVMAWVKVDDYESGRFYTVVGKWNDRDGDYRGYLLGISAFDGLLQPRFYISSDGSDYISADSSINLDTGTWYHLAGTFDGNVIKIYIFGNEEGSISISTSINSNNQPVLIGGDRAGGVNGRYYDGLIDEIKIYSCFFTQDEILEEL